VGGTIKVHNLGNVWLADGIESDWSAPVEGKKRNKDCVTVDSQRKAALSGGKVANHTSVINFCGCHVFQQPPKQLQPSAFPSFISGIEKDDSLLYSHKGGPSVSSQADRG
jgi:hypothetical protein